MQKFTPKPYQEQGIAHFLKKSFAGLFWPPGLGKTAVALHAFEILKKQGLVDKMMVISTVKVVTNTWPREIKKWMPYMSHAIVKGGPKTRIDALESDADILLMNMENTQWFADVTVGPRKKVKVGKGKKKQWKTFKPERPDLLPSRCMLVIDESSKFRNSGSKRFDALTRRAYGPKKRCLLNFFKRRYILTGSPAPKSLLNLWAQMFIVDLGESLGEYITHFRVKYFHPAGFKGYAWELNDGAAKLIYKRLTNRILRIGEGVLKLPPKKFVNRMIYMDEDQRSVYNEMERESILELAGEKITAVNAGVKTQKLRQLANGFVYGATVDKRRSSHQLNMLKAEEALELVEETQGTPALIGYIFDSDLKALQEVFGDEATYVTNATGDEEFNEIEESWNNGEIQVLVGQIDILSHGLNLQGTNASVIYYTVPWDLEAYEQFYRRVWRQGQKYTTMIYHLLAHDTVDDNVVLPSIERKDKRQQHLLKYLEEFMARRKKFVRADALTKVGNKEGMEIIAATILATGQKVPSLKSDVKDPGGVLVSYLCKRAKDWNQETSENFCKEVTKNPNYDGPTGYPTIKKMIEEIFCMDLESPIPPETYKMWIKGSAEPKGRKKMATKKSKGFGTASKKATRKKKITTKKASAKKKTTTKKTSTKKAKAPSKKASNFKEDVVYIKTDVTKDPKLEDRMTIVKKVRAAKGRGIKGTALLKFAMDAGLTEARAVGHINGCVKMGFITTK